MNKTYTRINWQNAPSEATALNDVNLNKMDSAIDTIDDRVVTHDTQITNLDAGKVDKESGKGLSTNDYTNTEKNKLATIQPYAMTVEYSPNYQSGERLGTLTTTNPNGEFTNPIYAPKPVSYLDGSSEAAVQNKVIKNALDGKVDKVSGKGLCAKSDVMVVPAADEIGEVIATIFLANQDNTTIQWTIYNQVEAISNAEIDALE